MGIMVNELHKVHHVHVNGVDVQQHSDSDKSDREKFSNDTILEVEEDSHAELRLKRRKLLLTCALGVFVFHFALGLLQESMLVFSFIF